MPHIAIAGAGIGGVAAALALADAGCRVTIYERERTLAPIGAGVQLSPNATAILRRLGVLEALKACVVEPEEVLIRRGRDGVSLAHVPLGQVAVARYGSPFLVCLRADLQGALVAQAARRPAIALHLGCAVAGYAPASEGARLLFADDRPSVTVDGLVAADGIGSTIRRQVLGARRDRARPAGRAAWRTLVPRSRADDHAQVPRANLWLGRKAHVVHYPVDCGRLVNVVAIIDDVGAADAEVGWSLTAEPAVLEQRFAHWALPVRRLIAAAPDWKRWQLFDRSPVGNWSDGAVTLLGDAAHPMLPFLAQGAAQAIEDAETLAGCVASAADLPAAFLTYQRLRGPRTASVQVASRRQAIVYHLGTPASILRDVGMGRLGPERLLGRYDWLYGVPVVREQAAAI